MSVNNSADKVLSNGNASLLLSSYEGEESFVVLERSTANDLGGSLSRDPTAGTGISQSLQTSHMDYSFPVFNNHFTNGLLENTMANHCQAVPVDGVDTSVTVASVSAEEIDKRLQEVLQENIVLKENLRQTNLAMKQQLSTVSLLQDRAQEAQKKQQSKFEATKDLILKLGSEKNELIKTNESLIEELTELKDENKELNKTALAFKEENAKLGSEKNELIKANESLIEELTELKDEKKELNKTAFAFKEENAKLVAENSVYQKQLLALREMTDNINKTSLQPSVKEVELYELVEQLTRKLEAVERARRQQEFDIDKLQAQLGRVSVELTETQRKLALTENALQEAQAQPKSSSGEQLVPVQYRERLVKYTGLLTQLRANIQEEQTKANSMNSWLSMTDPNVNSAQFEILELRRLLAEEQSQSVARKDNFNFAASTIQEMLVDFQKMGEELECVKAASVVKVSHELFYEEAKIKGFNEKIDELTAQLVQKDEALAIAERHLASLEEAVRLQSDGRKGDEEVQTLKGQVNVLTNQVQDKEETIKANKREISTLKTDVQKLQAIQENVTVLEEQAKIYQADFEAERKSREQLAAEKNRVVEDLRHLQRRNQQLLEELTKARAEASNAQSQRRFVPSQQQQHQQQQQHSPSPPLPRPQDEVIPPPRRFYCPNPDCNMMFTTVEPLQLHVITCLKLDD